MGKKLVDEWVPCSFCGKSINLKNVSVDKRRYYKKRNKIYCNKTCSLSSIEKKIRLDEFVKCSFCKKTINLKYVNNYKRHKYKKDNIIYCSKECSSNKNSETMSKRLKIYWSQDEYRQKMIVMSKKNWENPEYRQKLSNASKERWENKEYRDMMEENLKNKWQDFEYRQKMIVMSKKNWENPEYRQKLSKEMSERNIKNWENQEYRDMMLEKNKERIEKHGRVCITDLQLKLFSELSNEEWELEKSIRIPDNIHQEQTGNHYKADISHKDLKIIIEIDGMHHTKLKHKKHDRIRDEILTSLGYVTLRFKDQEVEEDIETCLNKIHSETIVQLLK